MGGDVVEALRASPDDQAVWTRFFRRLYPRVFYVLLRLSGGNRTTAEELSQEAFARFVRYGGLNKVRDEQSAGAFLRMIARNAYLSSVHPSKPVMEPLGDVPDSREPRDDGTFLAVEHAIDFDRVFRRLDVDQRRLLDLCVQGYSLKEIAQRLGTSYSAAAVRVHRLRRRLREKGGLW